jgi:hypothetical protein
VCINPQWIIEIPLTKETIVGRTAKEYRVTANKIGAWGSVVVKALPY